MKLEDIKRGMRVKLNIPASRPIKTLNGAYNEAGQIYKVLGGHGTCVRLSREKDFSKLIIPASEISLA